MSKARRTHDIVATVGTYKKDGEEKKRYVNVGSVFTDDDGRMSAKLDTIPVGPEWSGWLSFYPIKKDEGRRGPVAEENLTGRNVTYAGAGADEIPF